MTIGKGSTGSGQKKEQIHQQWRPERIKRAAHGTEVPSISVLEASPYAQIPSREDEKEG